MTRWYRSALLFALGVFAAASLAALFYEWRYVWPVQACDRRGAWWDEKDRQCLVPIPLWRITGRMPARVAPASAPAPAQRVAPGTQRTSPPS